MDIGFLVNHDAEKCRNNAERLSGGASSPLRPLFRSDMAQAVENDREWYVNGHSSPTTSTHPYPSTSPTTPAIAMSIYTTTSILPSPSSHLGGCQSPVSCGYPLHTTHLSSTQQRPPHNTQLQHRRHPQQRAFLATVAPPQPPHVQTGLSPMNVSPMNAVPIGPYIYPPPPQPASAQPSPIPTSVPHISSSHGSSPVSLLSANSVTYTSSSSHASSPVSILSAGLVPSYPKKSLPSPAHGERTDTASQISGVYAFPLTPKGTPSPKAVWTDGGAVVSLPPATMDPGMTVMDASTSVSRTFKKLGGSGRKRSSRHSDVNHHHNHHNHNHNHQRGPGPSPSGLVEIDTTSSSAMPMSMSPKVKTKRKRATPEQLAVLNSVFAQTLFPSTAARRHLAIQLGMTPRAVQIWFQNKRQNWRAKQAQVQHNAYHPLNHPLNRGYVRHANQSNNNNNHNHGISFRVDPNGQADEGRRNLIRADSESAASTGFVGARRRHSTQTPLLHPPHGRQGSFMMSSSAASGAYPSEIDHAYGVRLRTFSAPDLRLRDY
ncbi:hypothetical protein BC832DRAFT_541712 [Gaertneriomyces semiglobifer]|nr:hypothetical protein BC832DRAFT_541712 [Gaertneriomyces semiglobifer]